ncbi:SpoIIE family protein phosphatase [uncultured Bacteroides sp.]|jgi:sigma-B regulation protein RsbU (phosphoserine phosphatase)|uniref:PP2C family protein-serine/threonine phosphatase n=1 Tax=uncultured Bacteroides sp. TaxID=162156 RepID=UPI00280BC92B|nr:SpoIIE family protein phosphatase [uncultured Bacteroides sp.]
MAVKILSVDDELDLEVLLTQYFRRKIRKGEYEFHFAHNGLEALQMVLQQKDFDIILSDINMPEMDGLTLLTRINELRNPALKCIMVSAYGDMGNIRSAMNNGAFDFATKPIDLEDLSRTIEKAIEQIDFVRTSQCEHNQLESIKGDLAVAGEIQQAILPSKFPPFPDLVDKVDIFASMTPAKDVGGDFYDFFQIDADRIGFVIADVSGKGIPAALFMAVSRTLIRSTGLRGIPSNECISYANRLLCNESLDAMFVTVFYGIYTISTGVIDYTNAGHNPPYLLRRNNVVEALPLSQNFIVGVFDDFVYTNSTLTLEPGDALILYTDGVTEAFNEEKQQFGEKGLEKTLKSVPGADSKEIIEAIKEDVTDFSGNEPQSDDITILSLKRLK